MFNNSEHEEIVNKRDSKFHETTISKARTRTNINVILERRSRRQETIRVFRVKIKINLETLRESWLLDATDKFQLNATKIR